MKKEIIPTIMPFINASLGFYQPQLAIVSSGIECYVNHRNNIKHKKIKSFYDEFQSFLSDNLNQIDEEFLNSEYFHEILELILIKISSNSSKRKIIIFKEILINQLRARKKYDYSKIYLDISDILEEPEIELIKILLKYVDLSIPLKDSPILEPEIAKNKVREGLNEYCNSAKLDNTYNSFSKKYNLYKIEFHLQNLVMAGILTNFGGAYYFNERGILFVNFILGK